VTASNSAVRLVEEPGVVPLLLRLMEFGETAESIRE
jgi:hypothetical protein